MWILRRWLLLLMPLTCAHAAKSEPERPSFSLEYSAPAGCPSRLDFVSSIVRRTQAEVVARQAAQVVFTAHIEPRGSLFSGRLEVESNRSVAAQREVVPAPCHEVIESMAVIAAFILAANNDAAGGAPDVPVDGDGSETPADPPPSPTNTTNTVPPGSTSARPPSSQAAAAPKPPASAPTVQPRAEQPARKSPTTPAQRRPAATRPNGTAVPAQTENDPPPPSRLRPALVLSGGANFGVAPSPSAAVQAGLDLWLASERIWSPSVRAAFVYVRSSTETTPLGNARFRLLALRLHACPFRFPERSRVFARACARFDAGQLRASASGTAGNASAQRMPWVGGGATARLEAELLPYLGVEAYVSGLVLARADSFILEPDAFLVHEVPRISGSLGLDATIRWP